MLWTSFDGLARLLATRESRRAAITGGIADSTAAIVATRPRIPAQEASAIASPVTGDNSTVAHTEAVFLFVQISPSTTWLPKPDTEGVYTLTLSHPDGRTVYFSDRPQSIVGAAPTQAFLNGLCFTPDNPPNAAIVAGDEVFVDELTNPIYDPATGMLSYDATSLAPEEASEGISHLASQQTAGDRLDPERRGPSCATVPTVHLAPD